MHPLAEFTSAHSDPSIVSQKTRPNRLDLPLLAIIAIILIGSYPLLQVKIEEPVEGPINLASLMRFQRTSDEMTGSTAWVKQIPYWSPMGDEYLRQEAMGEPITPVTSLIDYEVLDYSETGFVVDSLEHTTVMEKVLACVSVG